VHKKYRRDGAVRMAGSYASSGRFVPRHPGAALSPPAHARRPLPVRHAELAPSPIETFGRSDTLILFLVYLRGTSFAHSTTNRDKFTLPENIAHRRRTISENFFI
jgi:hypothetical protein